MATTKKPIREVARLLIVLGDQLNRDSALFDDLDPARDVVWMIEAQQEATRVPSSLPRIAMFLAAMRHFRDQLLAEGLRVEYTSGASVSESLAGDLKRLEPRRVCYVEPGEWGVREQLRATLRAAQVEFTELPDRHFLCTHEEFERHARGRKQLRLEFFYRELRQRHRILLDGDGEPEGGQWNFDAENRKSFGRTGPAPGSIPPPLAFAPDAITRETLDDVQQRHGATHVGRLEDFDWPVSRAAALAALDDFIGHRLSSFGDHQDAMWGGETWLFHSRLSAALNLKLLDPREVIAAAEAAYRAGRAPLAAVEGFIRQILGWREYVRGIYWRCMPEYLERNAMHAHASLPDFFWTGETEYACLREVIAQTLRYGYAHHIQRLMVTGLFTLLLGVEPKRVHEWYLAVYVDAVEWVELPNTLGMSQYADGGVMASKPYVATGRYIDRMSDHCSRCRFDPGTATGPRACPYTTLYWDYLFRHERALAGNPRMSLQLRNAARYAPEARAAIVGAAAELRAKLANSDI